jgi:hypothetical protein
MNVSHFKNYAVIGTPTMYVLDSKGVIIQKPATVEELAPEGGNSCGSELRDSSAVFINTRTALRSRD